MVGEVGGRGKRNVVGDVCVRSTYTYVEGLRYVCTVILNKVRRRSLLHVLQLSVQCP